MTYIRKTYDVWEVMGQYEGQLECVNTELSRSAGRASLKEYRENEPGTSFTLRKRRERIVEDTNERS